jgi:hypothetical protein
VPSPLSSALIGAGAVFLGVNDTVAAVLAGAGVLWEALLTVAAGSDRG